MANSKKMNVKRKHRKAEARRKNRSNEKKSSLTFGSCVRNVVHARPIIPDEKVRFKASGLLGPQELELFTDNVEKFRIDRHVYIEVRKNNVAGGMTRVELVSEQPLGFLSDMTNVEDLLRAHRILMVVSP